MRHVVLATLCVLTTLGLLSSTVLGEDEAPKGAAAEKRQAKPRAAKPDGKQLIEKLTKDLKLTDEQKPKVAQVLETHRQAMANWWKENAPKLKDLHGQISKAQKDGDKEKVESLRAESKKLLEAQKTVQESLIKQLSEVLTEEQIAQAKEMLGKARRRVRAGMHVLAAMKRLELTEEQKGAMKKILADAKAEAEKAEGREAKAKIFAAAHEKIVSTVLTDEQRKAVKERMEKMKKHAAPREKGAGKTGKADSECPAKAPK